MNSLRHRISQKLFQPVDAASLGMFRILFGALMAWQAYYYLARDRFVDYYLEPSFHFTYDFFSWVKPLPEPYFRAMLILMTLAGLGIAVGIFFRTCTTIFLLGFSYVFLLDKAYYNNHYYAIILLTFLTLFTSATRWGSLAQLWRPHAPTVPYWNLFILRAQFFIIYFYGGIAKLNGDWLQGEPMRHWILKVADLPVVGPLMTTEWAPYFFSWGGVAFDLTIGFFLWWRKTRFLAFLAVLFFNLSNSLLFNIGVFPFLMIAAATLFDEPDWPRKLLGLKPVVIPSSDTSSESKTTAHRVTLAFLAAYFAIQILLPFRHFLIPGDVSWTEEGHLFSWHMKLRDKQGKLQIWVTDPATQATFQVDPLLEMNEFQYGKMMQRPQFIYQYIQHVKTALASQDIQDPIIRVDSWVSLNGRPYQQLIDPDVNLAAAHSYFFSPDPWILPLDPQLRPGTLKGESPSGEKKGLRMPRRPLETESSGF